MSDHFEVADEHARQLRQLETIQRIAARLTRLGSTAEVGATICTEVRAVIAHDEAHVLVVDGSGRWSRVAASAGLEDRPVSALPTDGVAGEAVALAIATGTPAVVSAVAGVSTDRPGPHSLLVVPLQYDDRITGAICLLARGSGVFDADDLRLLQILSDQAAVAIENSRLLHGRDQLVRELAGLLEISEAAAAADDERKLASLLAVRLTDALGADGALVAMRDDGALRVVATHALGKQTQALDVADSAAGRHVLSDGRAVVVQCDAVGWGPDTLRLRSSGVRTAILLPLNAGGRTIGLVALIATEESRNPSRAEIQASEAMASLAATGLEKLRLLEQLRSAADVDLVSGVHNHRYLQERLTQEIARSARSDGSLALLMLDLDQFKPINDRFGHGDGDRVLRSIAATIKAHVRASDTVARYGGDEFIVLMADTPGEPAEQVARRVVAALLQQRHAISDGNEVGVGVSAGLAVYPDDGRTPAQLLRAADAAMYAAKRSGGQRVERWRSSQQMEFGEPIRIRATA